jgi:hypothetical protein
MMPIRQSVFRAVLALALALPTLASAKELAGVTMADTLSAEGKELKLNGLGLRKKLFFKVYVAGLYVEAPNKDGQAILSADSVRVTKMHMLRTLEKKQITEAIEKAFKENAADKLPALKDRLEKFMGLVSDIKEGEDMVITYVPGKGTKIAGGDREKTVVEGKDFADALFSVWIGAHPVDDDLRKGMLGG